MLREGSTKEGVDAELRGVIDSDIDIGVRECGPLCALATALVHRDSEGLAAARAAVVGGRSVKRPR